MLLLIKVYGFLGFTLYIVHSMGFDKCKMAHSHHYSIIERIISPPKNPFYLFYFSIEPLVSAGLFTISTVLLFAECHIVGIIQYAALLIYT